jgi:hypothetical protein
MLRRCEQAWQLLIDKLYQNLRIQLHSLSQLCDPCLMELTWLPDIPQSRSRTRALRACPQCQRSKVRPQLRLANLVADETETMSTPKPGRRTL